MRSSFYYWCKRSYRAFTHEFKTDWQFRWAAIVLILAVTAMSLLANNSALLHRFLQP